MPETASGNENNPFEDHINRLQKTHVINQKTLDVFLGKRVARENGESGVSERVLNYIAEVSSKSSITPDDEYALFYLLRTLSHNQQEKAFIRARDVLARTDQEKELLRKKSKGFFQFDEALITVLGGQDDIAKEKALELLARSEFQTNDRQKIIERFLRSVKGRQNWSAVLTYLSRSPQKESLKDLHDHALKKITDDLSIWNPHTSGLLNYLSINDHPQRQLWLSQLNQEFLSADYVPEFRAAEFIIFITKLPQSEMIQYQPLLTKFADDNSVKGYVTESVLGEESCWQAMHVFCEQTLQAVMNNLKMEAHQRVGVGSPHLLLAFRYLKLRERYPEMYQSLLKTHGHWKDEGRAISFLAAMPTKDQNTEVVEKLLESRLEIGLVRPVFTYMEKNIPESEIGPMADVLNRLHIACNTLEDKVLRAKVFHIARMCIQDNDFPLTMIMLEKPEKIPFLVCMYRLGADVKQFVSWNLEDPKIKSSTVKLIKLATQEDKKRKKNTEMKGVFSEIIFPYLLDVPSTTKVYSLFSELVMSIDVLETLDEFLKDDELDLVEESLESIRQVQRKLGVDLNHKPTIELVKAHIRELRKLQDRSIQVFSESLGLGSGEIGFGEIIKLHEAWGGEIDSILSVTSICNEYGSEDLRKMMGEILKYLLNGRFIDARYDLSNTLVQRQLEPLLRSSTVEEARLIDAYRSEEFVIELHEEVRKEKTGLMLDQKKKKRNAVAEFTRRVSSEGHNHLDQLQNIISVQIGGFDLLELLNEYLTRGSSDVVGNLGQVRQALMEVGTADEHIKILLGLLTLFKEIHLLGKDEQKAVSKLQKQVGSLIAKVKDYWPGLYESQLVRGDLESYFLSTLTNLVSESSAEDTIKKKKIHLSYFSDHPKILLEIGKYPDSGSCQNYESSTGYNQALPGYVFDSHIMAWCVSELEITDEEFPEKAYEQLKTGKFEDLDIDFGLRTGAITIDGQSYSVNISRPIHRRMVMLGLNESHNPHLTFQPLYEREHGEVSKEAYKTSAQAKVTVLNQVLNKQVKFNSGELPEEDVSIVGSRSPEGHYSDLMSEIVGFDGDDYVIAS